MEKMRDYLFDNYKAILIVLVVVGHFIELTSDDNTVLVVLKWVIFSFHMPAFAFISGYFSKKKQDFYRLVQQLLVPYFIFEVLYYLLYGVIGKDTSLALLYPKFSLWYLLAMFMWKLITPVVKKIPGYLWIAFAIGIAVGASSLDDNYLTLPRMFTFYPFFLMGTDLNRARIDRLRERISRGKATAIFLIINFLLVWMALCSDLSIKIFYGRYDYEYLDLTLLQGVMLRIACYIISLLMIYVMAVLIPGAKNEFSYLGQRTMSIYLFHGLVFETFRRWESMYQSMGNIVEMVILIGASILTIWLLSRKPFVKLTYWITHVPLFDVK